MRRFHFDLIDSTNSEARRMAPPASGEPWLVTATEQAAGRGRQGRTWHSPRGGAWMSLAWPARKPPAEYASVSLVAALALLRALRDVVSATADFRIKWPNDLLIHDQKVAGILCEQRLVAGGSSEAVIIGIGVNVDFDPALLPAGLRHPATTLRAALGETIEVETVIDAVAAQLLDVLEDFESSGLTPHMLDELRENLAYVGQLRTWELLAGSIKGRVAGVDDAGRLLLDTASGRTAFESGEFAPSRLPT
jgi:BirA family biotin operon repressor/biotin-[acetyl-CoA-carboxylase] ligase